MRTAEEILKEHVFCECGEIYTSRGLTAPDCPLCSMHSCYIEAMEAYGKALVKEVRQGGYASIEQEDGSFPWLVWDDEALNNLVK